MSTSPSRTLAIRIAAVTASLVMVGSACSGGSDDEKSGGDNGGDGSESAVDASLCPVDALDGADGPVEVVLWHGITGLAAQTLDDLAEKYNAEQDRVTVRVESQGTYEEQQKKYTDSLRDPANLPGILLAEDTNTQFMIDSQSAIPAAACIEADPDAGEVYDQLMPAVKEGYSVQGVQWPASFGVSTPVIYYNKSHFTEAGLDPESPPQTLAEIKSAAEAIKAVRPDSFPFVYRADAWWLEHLSTNAGDALVNMDNGREGLADTSELLNESTAEWTTWMEEMSNEGLQQTKAYSQTIDAYLAVANQASSMLIETSTAATTVDALITGTVEADDIDTGGDFSGAQIPDLEIGVGQLPGFEKVGSGQVGGNAWYIVGVGRSPEQVAAAWDYMKWVNQTDNQVLWTLQGSYLPVFSGAAESPELQAYFTDTLPGEWLATAFESLQKVNPDFPGPVIGPYKEFRSEVRNALETSLIGGTPIDETFDAANTQFQAALDTYKAEVGG
ncbi:MAG: extracellular solute-binding protein [Actinomycetia bacterium]|nr:extracellular solute-binding protein [Actinomycetes bacterium]